MAEPSRERQAPLGRASTADTPRQRKSRPLSIYLDPEDTAAIRRAASYRKLSVSEFVRRQALLDDQYGAGDLIEQIYCLSSESRNHPALEAHFRALVEELTGVAISPPRVEPPALAESMPVLSLPAPVLAAPVALPPPPLPHALPAPAARKAVVSETYAATRPVRVRPRPSYPEYVDVYGPRSADADLQDLLVQSVAGIWRWLTRVGTRAGIGFARDSMYHKLIGRTPLQFVVAAGMLAALPVATFGSDKVGYYLLGATGLSATTVLAHLPGDERGRQQIGYIVTAVPTNIPRIDACVAQQRTSRHEFWCKFKMKSGR